MRRNLCRALFFGGLVVVLGACGGNSGFGSLGLGSGENNSPQDINRAAAFEEDPDQESLFDLFANRDDPNTTVEVNKYIWNASLEILNFMPIQSVDPFTGVIVMGFGTPPGSSRAYRATVLVQDPALDARSLRLAMATRSGPVSADTIAAIEDSILTRARQLRLQDSNL